MPKQVKPNILKDDTMITSKIIKDSVAANSKRIITYELEYPRFIHSEMMTHRVFSRNSASSRAIPISKMISLVWNNPAEPHHWGKNQSGMQAREELKGRKQSFAKTIWRMGGKTACIFAWILSKVGVHKQIANRVLEPWSHIKVIVTSTEWDNFFTLRDHPDAQPEIHILAKDMREKYDANKPRLLLNDQWHLPYIDDYIVENNEQRFYINDERITLEQAQKISASLCAQVSYRLVDSSLDKAVKIFDRLITSKPLHASPMEHQATPLDSAHQSSGNFRGWLQFRQTLNDII